MELTALLLLPLVGGYLFANTCNATRFRAAREEGHRLYFRAAFYGVLLFFVSAVIRLLLVKAWPAYRTWEAGILAAIQPILKDGKEDSAIVVLLAFFAMGIGWLAGHVFNRLLGETPWLRAAIQDDEFEALLHHALARAMPVALTMENGKVYVGFVRKTFKPKVARKNFRILPLMSGYRDSAGKINFTTFYDKAYEQVRQSSRPAKLYLEDFEMVFPTERVQSAGLFDVQTYSEFQKFAPRQYTLEALERERKAWRGRRNTGTP